MDKGPEQTCLPRRFIKGQQIKKNKMLNFMNY